MLDCYCCIDNVYGWKVFNSLDVKASFHNIPKAQSHIKHCRLVSPEGVYIHQTIPFGFKPTPQYFWHIIETVVGMALRPKCAIYIDYITISRSRVHDNFQHNS